MYKRFKHYLTKTIDAFLVINLMFMTSIVFIGIIMRYVLKMPLIWGEEIALLGQIWLTFLSVGVLFYKADHMVVDYLSSRLSFKNQLLLQIINYTIIVIFLISLTYAGVLVTNMTKKSISPGLKVSIAFMYVPAVIGGILGLFYCIDIIVNAFKELINLRTTETQEGGK